MQAYRIIKYNERHEDRFSRRLRHLKYIQAPVSQESVGWKTLKKLDGGIEAIGVYLMLVELAGTMPIRGVLANDSRPYNALNLATLADTPVETMERGLALLMHEEVHFIDLIDFPVDPRLIQTTWREGETVSRCVQPWFIDADDGVINYEGQPVERSQIEGSRTQNGDARTQEGDLCAPGSVRGRAQNRDARSQNRDARSKCERAGSQRERERERKPEGEPEPEMPPQGGESAPGGISDSDSGGGRATSPETPEIARVSANADKPDPPPGSDPGGPHGQSSPDSDADPDDPVERQRAWVRWRTAVGKLFARRGTSQYHADATSARRMFDEHLWPPEIDEQRGEQRVEQAIELIPDAAQRKKRMGWLTSRIKQFPNPEDAS